MIGPIVLLPLVSVLGFLLNSLVVKVVYSQKYQEMYFKGELMYKFIQLNGIFSMIICLISLLSLYDECISSDSIFCPALTEQATFHEIRTEAFHFISESFKTGSLLANLFFSLERYFNTIKAKHRWALRFQKMNFKSFIAGILAISLLSSSAEFGKSYNFTGGGYGYRLFASIYNTLTEWIIVMSTVHIVLNNLVLFLLNFLIDVLLVVHVRKDLSKKKRSVVNESTTKSTKKLDDIKKARLDTNRMIVLSLLLFFITCAPELSLELYFVFAKFEAIPYSFTNICMADGLCKLMKSFCRFLYLLSYCVNVLLLYKYNKNIRTALQDLLHLKASKKVSNFDNLSKNKK